MEVQARKFYSERNMYLCGFTLFLSLILNRTYVMILDVLRLEEEVKTLRGDKSAKGSKVGKLGDVNEPGEVIRGHHEYDDTGIAIFRTDYFFSDPSGPRCVW